MLTLGKLISEAELTINNPTFKTIPVKTTGMVGTRLETPIFRDEEIKTRFKQFLKNLIKEDFSEQDIKITLSPYVITIKVPNNKNPEFFLR